MSMPEENLKAITTITIDGESQGAQCKKINQGKITVESGEYFFLLFTKKENAQKYLNLLLSVQERGLHVAPFTKELISVQFGEKTYPAVRTERVMGYPFKGVHALETLIRNESEPRRRTILRFLRTAAELKLQDIQGFITTADSKPICFIDINCNTTLTPSADISGLLNEFGINI